MEAMTPAEFEERMITIEETTSKRQCAYEMKKLVVELLTDLGYGDGAEIFADLSDRYVD